MQAPAGGGGIAPAGGGIAPAGGGGIAPAGGGIARQAGGVDKIRHVVIIMQENRSFDSYFGTFPGARSDTDA